MSDHQHRIQVCMTRLNLDEVTAHLVCRRNVQACQEVVDALEISYIEADRLGDGGETLRRLWDARTYLQLAKAGAPETGAFGCECDGSGRYYGAGYTENGVFKGKIGTCFRCGGKGWQTEADRKRNRYYDDHVRRISF